MKTFSSQSAAPDTVTLTCHPATPCATVRRIEAQVRRTDATLELRYCVEGDIERLLIAEESVPRRADKLWQHTCFEAFIDTPPAGYYEFNFSPSTEWAIYRFSGYREGMTVVEAAQPARISVRRAVNQLDVDVAIDLQLLPALLDSAGVRIALSAVIEDAQHRLSYWALVHPPGKPDFHHAAGFTLMLPEGHR